MSYTNKMIIKDVATQLDITQKDVTEVVTAFVSTIKNVLAVGDEVSIADFGKFKITERAARTGRNPQDGSPLEIPAKKVVKFAPAKVLKEAVAGA